MLNAASVAVRVEAVVETAALTDKMVVLRLTVSADKAPLNTPSTAEKDTDALLNALDSDATAFPRTTVWMERAVVSPESTAARDGMAVLLTDATALMRADISAKTLAFSPVTLLRVLGLRVKLGLV